MAIQLQSDNEARKKFYDSGGGQFAMKDIPPEVFGRLNVHAQERLKGGHTVPINPGFYAASRDKPVATSLLGAGPVAPGQMTQPAEVVAQYNPSVVTPSGQQVTQAPVYSKPDASGELGAPKLKPLSLTSPIEPAIQGKPSGGPKPSTAVKSFKGEVTPGGSVQGSPVYTPYGVGYVQNADAYSDEKLNSLLSQAGSYLLGQQLMKSSVASSLGISQAMNVPLANVSTGGVATTTYPVGTYGESMAGVPGQTTTMPTGGEITGGTLLSGASAGYMGYTLSEIITGEMGYYEQDYAGEAGAAAGGTAGFVIGTALGSPILGAFLGAALGGTAGTMMGGEKLHGGEESVGSTFYALEARTGQFTGDRFADFAKNMALARLANPNAGADSISDALRGMGDRVINEGDVDSQTIEGFKQLIKEGYVTKEEILSGIQMDLELFRKDVEAIKEPPRPTPVAKPDSEIKIPEPAPAPQPPQMPTQPMAMAQPEPTKPKAKSKRQKTSTIMTSPMGIEEEPMIYIPSIGGSIPLSLL
ncbi:MAG: hypothetical protein Unbinned6242contig1001_9 [Prokaryotic dsDNA virus sp.]|nr:MAG: hypothetical protein Unbinned6242contig1001_9 [Prokaryotic dsDNA virus sp.]|tara:strand:+ start:15635 stop:17221 length:1587 start_codon:yes stop_codon:yes gene_type:complete